MKNSKPRGESSEALENKVVKGLKKGESEAIRYKIEKVQEILKDAYKMKRLEP